MPRQLIRAIPVKRLRPHCAPEDCTIEVIGLRAPDQVNARGKTQPVTIFYVVWDGDKLVAVDRMEEMEREYGAESIFNDRAGNCYVSTSVFDLVGTHGGHMPKKNQPGRRIDLRMASKVQCGISLQFISGVAEARRYLVNCGTPPEVIERVLSYPSARRPSGNA